MTQPNHKKSVCENCGGALELTADGEYKICQLCGTTYDRNDLTILVRHQGTVVMEGVTTRAQLHKRAQIALDEGDYAMATSCYRDIIDKHDAEDAEAWWGLVCASVENFTNLEKPLTQANLGRNYQMALNFASPGQREKFNSVISEHARLYTELKAQIIARENVERKLREAQMEEERKERIKQQENEKREREKREKEKQKQLERERKENERQTREREELEHRRQLELQYIAEKANRKRTRYMNMRTGSYTRTGHNVNGVLFFAAFVIIVICFPPLRDELQLVKSLSFLDAFYEFVDNFLKSVTTLSFWPSILTNNVPYKYSDSIYFGFYNYSTLLLLLTFAVIFVAAIFGRFAARRALNRWLFWLVAASVAFAIYIIAIPDTMGFIYSLSSAYETKDKVPQVLKQLSGCAVAIALGFIARRIFVVLVNTANKHIENRSIT